LRKGRVLVESRVVSPTGGVIYTGKVESKPVELLIDADGRMKRARCLCGHFQKAGLRMGPCRHLLALRAAAFNQSPEPAAADQWFAQLRAQAGWKGGA